MKIYIALLSCCIFCFGLFASETIDDPLFEKLLYQVDSRVISARLPYLIKMQEKFEMNNQDIAQHFSIQLAVEIKVIEKIIEENIRSSFENISYFKEQIYNSSSADEIKSCLSTIEDLKRHSKELAVLIQYTKTIREKYCHWLDTP